MWACVKREYISHSILPIKMKSLCELDCSGGQQLDPNVYIMTEIIQIMLSRMKENCFQRNLALVVQTTCGSIGMNCWTFRLFEINMKNQCLHLISAKSQCELPLNHDADFSSNSTKDSTYIKGYILHWQKKDRVFFSFVCA